jgi:hypothetical protein
MSLVKINVGGRVFVTEETILHSRGENMITRLLHNVTANDMKREVDEHGNLFINGDPGIFAVILDFLRLGKLHVPVNISWNKIQAELDYHCIDITPEAKDSSPCDAVKEGLYQWADDENFGDKLKEFALASRLTVAQKWYKLRKKDLMSKFVEAASTGVMETKTRMPLDPISENLAFSSDASKEVRSHLISMIESLKVKVSSLIFWDGRDRYGKVGIDLSVSWNNKSAADFSDSSDDCTPRPR